jgi:hypothetical protein
MIVSEVPYEIPNLVKPVSRSGLRASERLSQRVRRTGIPWVAAGALTQRQSNA